MHSSIELTRTSSENTPLLGDSPEEPVNENVKKFPRQSIFTCAIVCILFTELCEQLTVFSINGNLVLFATNKDHLGMSADAASILTLMFQGINIIIPFITIINITIIIVITIIIIIIIITIIIIIITIIITIIIIKQGQINSFDRRGADFPRATKGLTRPCSILLLLLSVMIKNKSFHTTNYDLQYYS